MKCKKQSWGRREDQIKPKNIGFPFLKLWKKALQNMENRLILVKKVFWNFEVLLKT